LEKEVTNYKVELL